jgi:multidrug resistance efflux pump
MVFWLGAASGVAILAAGWWLCREATGSAAAPEQPVPRRGGVVCIGYVDVESGLVSLYPLQPGRVVAAPVAETNHVSAGTILLRMDDTQAKLRLREAEAALEGACIQLAEARKLPEQHRSRLAQQQCAAEAAQRRAAMARLQFERQKDLDRNGLLGSKELAIAAEQLKEAKAGERAEAARLAELKLRNPQADVRRAEQEVAMLEARLGQARQALEECTLRAPQSGTMSRLLVTPGDVVSVQSPRPALLFCPDGPRLVRAEVEQEYAGRVMLGQPVRIEDDTIGGSTWRARLSASRTATGSAAPTHRNLPSSTTCAPWRCSSPWRPVRRRCAWVSAYGYAWESGRNKAEAVPSPIAATGESGTSWICTCPTGGGFRLSSLPTAERGFPGTKRCMAIWGHSWPSTVLARCC